MIRPKLATVALVLGMALVVGAAQATPGRVEATRGARTLGSRTRVPGLDDRLLAEELATTFMTQFQSADYPAQWAELASVAREQWPSEVARDRMLAAKFAGAARVTSFRLGQVSGGASWTSPEDPSESVSGAFAVPVSVAFLEPAQVGPVGAVADYQSTRLVIDWSPVWAPPQALRAGTSAEALLVVGEGPASLDAPIINPAVPTDQTASVPIVMYHLVGPLPLRSQYASIFSFDLDTSLSVTPSEFQAEVSYMVADGYTSISLTRLFDHLDYGLPLPARPVVLTFDDGFANEYQYAVPVLRAAGYTAIFFPCSGLIGITNGHEAYMSAADLATLSHSGFWVEDHTYNDGTSLWGRSRGEIDALAGTTAQALEAITGSPIQFIAYSGLWPYRSPTQAGPGETELFSELAPLGYVGGLEDDWLPGSAWIERSGQGWELPRLRAYPSESTASFASILAYG